jgi:hypothetical protein
MAQVVEHQPSKHEFKSQYHQQKENTVKLYQL